MLEVVAVVLVGIVIVLGASVLIALAIIAIALCVQDALDELRLYRWRKSMR